MEDVLAALDAYLAARSGADKAARDTARARLRDRLADAIDARIRIALHEAGLPGRVKPEDEERRTRDGNDD